MYWKFLRAGSRGPFTDHPWTAGVWVGTAAAPQPCRTGVHACRVADLPFWLDDELWEIELDGPVHETDAKVVAPRGRLVRRVPAWTSGLAREFAETCVGRAAEHAAHEVRGTQPAEADALLAAEPADLQDVATRIAGGLSGPGARRTANLCGYAADAADALDRYPVATVAYIAARAAGLRPTDHPRGGYDGERSWQAGWLARRLDLPAG